MNEILAAIKQHLKRPLKVSQLDYYQVIGLEPFCADKSAIESALKTASKMIRNSESSPNEAAQSNPPTTDLASSLQVVEKLLRQAQSILLDPAKKTAYDSQLAKLFESQKKQKELGKNSAAHPQATIGMVHRKSNQPSAAASTPTTAPNASELLPGGDPMQPFGVAYLSESATSLDSNASASASPTANTILANLTPDKRRTELSELFPSLMLMSIQTEPTEAQPPAWLVAADRKPTKNKSYNDSHLQIANPTSRAMPSSMSAPDRESESKRPEAKRGDLVEHLRTRRRRRSLLGVGGMVLAALGLLGFASFQFLSNRQQLAQQDRKQPAGGQADNAQGNPLPDTNPSGTKLPDLNIGASTKGRNRKGDNPSQLPQLPSVQRSENLSGPDTSTRLGGEPAMAQPQGGPTPMVPAGQPEPTPEPAMTNETPEWKAGMTQAKEALLKGDPTKFEPLIAAMLGKAMTKAGKDQTARLDQAGQLLKIYAESFQEARIKAKGASSLKVGATDVSIVESTPEKLIIRAQGKNQTYEWDKLPFGIATAICDLGLSDSAPVDIAARALFFSLSPFYQEAAKSNNLVSKRIDGWFERSLGKDSVRSDLKQFLTDRYE